MTTNQQQTIKKSPKTIVTARSVTDNSNIFIQCSDVSQALEIAGQLHRITLKEHTYVQVRLRGSTGGMKSYKNMTHYFLGGA